MAIKKEYLNSGMRLIHPTGKESFVTLAGLRQLRATHANMLTFIQGQIALIDKDLAEIETKLQK